MLSRRQCTELFPPQFCLESLGHYTGFLAVQCCPKSIKTTLNRIFSRAMLSGASWTTLHSFFPVQCCPKSIKTTLNRIFACAMLSGDPHEVFIHAMLLHSPLTTLHRKTICNVVVIYVGQHCARNLPV